MNLKRIIATLPAVSLILFGCSSRLCAGDSPQLTSDAHAGLDAVLWVQTSAEYKATAHAAYRQAMRAVDAGLLAATRTAAIEQTGEFTALLPAVIVDIDETILDNSPFNGELALSRSSYSDSLWSEWVSRAQAKAVPGALDFVRYCAQKKVEVFYITNRSANDETATRKNLTELGFPLPEDRDVIYCYGEKSEWKTSDKGARRSLVAATHRILVMVGDDLGDFLSGVKDSLQKREALVEKRLDKFGDCWFIIPNPMYGSWERAIYDFRVDLPPAEKLRIKATKVKSFREEQRRDQK
jgi:acid phosphatase